jgi:hypothetical protein
LLLNFKPIVPFSAHPNLITPPNDTVLWRYSDFAKFMDLVERHKLWFSRADQFEDPLEGTFTDAEIEDFRSRPAGDSILSLKQMIRTTTFVNCWRAGKNESMAMWDIYGKGSGVVAIKSTVGLLKEVVSPILWPVFIAQVDYVDWGDLSFRGNALQMCARKDLSYAHEAEVRAIIWSAATNEAGIPMYPMTEDSRELPLGLELDADPARFVTEVIVGPREQLRIVNLVKAIMARYGLEQQIKASDRLKDRGDGRPHVD